MTERERIDRRNEADALFINERAMKLIEEQKKEKEREEQSHGRNKG